MKNKTLLFSIIINIIFIIIFFYYSHSKDTNTNKDTNININKVNINNLALKNTVWGDKKLSNIKWNTWNITNICENIILWKNKSHFLSSIYMKYKEIKSNKNAEYDYLIQKNVFIEKKCDLFKGKNKKDYNTCIDIKNNNLEKIKKSNIPEFDKLLIESYLTKKNKCWKNKDCVFYINFLDKLKNKTIKFPLNITTSRDIEFYAYNELYPSKYKENLDKLFLSECIKIIKEWKSKN